MHHMSASAYLRDTATTQHDSDTDVGYGIPRNVLVSPRLGLIAHVDRMEMRVLELGETPASSTENEMMNVYEYV